MNEVGKDERMGLWLLFGCIAVVVLAAVMAIAVDRIYTDAVENAPGKAPPEAPISGD